MSEMGEKEAVMQFLGDRESHNLRFIPGSTHLVVGPSGSGKTFRTADILRLKNDIFVGGADIKNVVFCYAAWQPIYSLLQKEGVVTRFIKKRPTSEEFVRLVADYKDRGGSIVCLDDFMTQIDEDLVDIVTVQSRHYNTSTFILFQSLFPPNKLARQISLNVKYLHVHKNPRENAQIATLARQVSPPNSKRIVAAYHEVTREPHQCLLIDMTQQCPERLRFRSHYLPREFPMRVWASGGTEDIL